LFHLLHTVFDAQVAENTAHEPLMDTIENYYSSKYDKYSNTSVKWNWCQKRLSERDMYYSGPVSDFLGLAASNGLYLYVLKNFQQHPKRTDEKLTTYLVSRSMPGGGDGFLKESHMQLMLMLLSNGADPTKTFQFPRRSPQISIWSQFLCLICAGLQWGYTIDWCELVEAFLRNGADLHEKGRHILENVDEGSKW
jgi:hypothetical protein